MGSSVRDDSEKLVIDSIHGDIHLNAREVEVIDTPSFQRLRQLKQLAMAHLVYPAATHTRFAHSIGVLGIMIRILRAAKSADVKLPRQTEENLRLAALLHDVGHYPYSHLMESIDRVKLTEEHLGEQAVLNAGRKEYPSHEEIGALIVTTQRDLLEAIGGKDKAQAVADFFTKTKVGSPQLSKLIHSSLDLDRLDYLLRDSHGTGVPYGQIDINYLLNNLRVSPEQTVGFSEKALPAVEHLLLARFFMHRAVYYHKTIYGVEEACRQLLRRLRDRDGKNHGVPIDGDKVRELVTSNQLGGFTDSFVDNIVQKAAGDSDPVICTLARAIQSRRPPKLLKEVLICEDKEAKHHAGKIFRTNCKNKLHDLADEFKILLGQFILCETRPLTVGERPQDMSAAEAAKLGQEAILNRASEEEEKDIKVFDGEAPEPKSLMDIDYSLIAKYSRYFFQIFRLYVVCDSNNKDKVVQQLKEHVKGWDKE